MIEVTVTLYNQTKDQTINLESETTVTVGRGSFECNDKRVSKKHGEITVMEEQIRLKACHANPIFIKKNGANIQQVLLKGTEIILTNADRFSLLPDDFEYEIRIVKKEIAFQEPSTELRIRTIDEINDNLEVERSETDLEGGNLATDDPRIIEERSTENSEIDKEQLDTNIKVGSESVKSPIKADESSSSHQCNGNRKRGLLVVEEEEPCKKLKSSDEVQPVVVKPDPDEASSSSTTFPSSTFIKPDPDAASGKVKLENSSSETALNPGDPNLRPSCEHGIRCYRHTSEHRLSTAHPNDADYRRPSFPPAPANTPQCPFGAQCYRRNPAHFQRLAHPSSSCYIQPLTRVFPVPSIPTNDDNQMISEEEDDFDDIDNDQDFPAEENSDQDDLEEDDNNLEE